MVIPDLRSFFANGHSRPAFGLGTSADKLDARTAATSPPQRGRKITAQHDSAGSVRKGLASPGGDDRPRAVRKRRPPTAALAYRQRSVVPPGLVGVPMAFPSTVVLGCSRPPLTGLFWSRLTIVIRPTTVVRPWWRNPLVHLGSAHHSCGHGGIGIRAGFRFQYRKVCGFESHCPHHFGFCTNPQTTQRAYSSLAFFFFTTNVTWLPASLYISSSASLEMSWKPRPPKPPAW